MRGVIAIAAALIVACSAPAPNPTPAAAEQPAPIATATPAAPSESGPTAPPQATVPASPLPSPAAPASALGPVSAGVVADVGVLFFTDWGENGARSALYRYDGASGTIATVAPERSFSVGHETAVGIHLQGEQGSWRFLRWDGTFDQSSTVCQEHPLNNASWCSVSASGVSVGYGSHTGPGPGPFTRPVCPPAFIRIPGEARGRPLLPPGYCVMWAQVNAGGTQFLVGGFAPDASPAPGVLVREGRCEPGYYTFDDISCYRLELWVMPVGVGVSPQPLRLSPELPNASLALSPDGRFVTAGYLGGLFLIDVSTGRATYLGSADTGYQGVGGSPRWSVNGRLAFVRGGGQASWFDKTIVVREPDGPTRAPPGADRPWTGLTLAWCSGSTCPWIGRAPAWDSEGKRLAWIASMPGNPHRGDLGQDYLDGGGDVGDRRVLVSDFASDPLVIRCGEGVAEGVRWARDGTALLLLCRRPGARANAFELWLHRLDVPGGAAVPIVRGLTLGGVDAYGQAPSLFTSTAWSRAVGPLAPR